MYHFDTKVLTSTKDICGIKSHIFQIDYVLHKDLLFLNTRFLFQNIKPFILYYRFGVVSFQKSIDQIPYH